jgi:hypothetical protein
MLMAFDAGGGDFDGGDEDYDENDHSVIERLP